MKQLEIKPLRFGLKYANDEVVSSKQLQAENKLLEEKVNQLKKIIEDDHKKTEERRMKEKEQPKSFRTREIKIRGFAKEILETQKKENPHIKKLTKKRGLKAYEEQLKAQKTAPGPSEALQMQRQTELEGFMESQGLGRYMANLKTWGISSLTTLQVFDVKKLGLLPGHEIKLTKRLAEIGGQESKDRQNGQTKMDDSFEDDVLVNKQTPEHAPQKNPKKFSSILLRVQAQSRNMVEQEGRKAKVEFLSPAAPKKEMKSCGNDSTPEESRKDRLGCWVCLKLVPRSEVKSHPIIENKMFCSVVCLREEFKRCSASCGNCRKVIIKPEGVLINTDWYCSEACSGQRVSDDEQGGDECGRDTESRERSEVDTDGKVDYGPETEININSEVDLDFGELI